MSIEKQTPGNWAVEDLGLNCFFIAGSVGQTGTHEKERDYYNRIASVTQRDPHPTHDGGISRSEALANARVMAQSKSLLNELRLVLREFEDQFVNAAGDRPYADLLHEFAQIPVVATARVVIDKAISG